MENEIIETVQSTDLKVMMNEAFEKNKTSHDRCIEFGKFLLNKISENPMTDELDEEVKGFIIKSEKTLSIILERRKPITQMMDSVKKYFTGLENEINPKNEGNVINQLQQARNKYAADKLRKQKEEAARLERERLIEVEKSNIKTRAEREIRDQASRLIDDQIRKINFLFTSVSLENYDGTYEAFQNLKWGNTFDVNPCTSVLLSQDVVSEIYKSVKSSIGEELKVFIDNSINMVVDELKMKLPSKKIELIRIKELEEKNAEEAKAQREELARKDAEEAARKEHERDEQERIRKQSEALNASQPETFFLSPEAPKTKVKVKQKMEILSPAAFINIIQCWWNGEGSSMSVEELSKKLKFAITYVEKEANKNEDNRLSNPDIKWIDDVTAR